MLKETKRSSICGRIWQWNLCLAILLFCITLVIGANADIVRGHVLVRIGAGEDIEALDDDYGTKTDAVVSSLGLYAVHTPAYTDEETFAELLNMDPRVVYSALDTTIELPDVHGTQFHLAFDAGPDPGDYTDQLALQQIHIGNALSKTTGAGVIVAVLDTGASFNHPALQSHYLLGYNAIHPGATAEEAADGMLNLAVGHGTMVAGIIAEVAPGAQILPIRVLNGDGNGTVLGVLRGLDYAISRGAHVINMSFGASENSPALEDGLATLHDEGVILVAAAGNDNAKRVNYPAAYRHVIAVTSIEGTKHKSSYANFGKEIAVGAPGTGIRSTYINNGYACWSGTSFSTSFVSAEAALVRSLYLHLETDEIKGRVRDTAHSVDKLNPHLKGLLGHGLIDVEDAVLHWDD